MYIGLEFVRVKDRVRKGGPVWGPCLSEHAEHAWICLCALLMFIVTVLQCCYMYTWLRCHAESVVIVVCQRSSGGPIIAVQLENEYGAYGDDMPYKTCLAQVLLLFVVNLLLISRNKLFQLQSIPLVTCCTHWHAQ